LSSESKALTAGEPGAESGRPRCDISNMTATVAAKLLKEIAGMMVKTAR
jgi:hypothetical protein